ncbi:unnamed protein product [Gongylonema pulchrum]|uniref:BRF1 domain-containing protein n=1 Tax=Gongylonema pulchrum TaxID=637853 RepID=A0A183E6P0_9BILA|nr:unnamed protein product [Gongylonema pulchrum]
MREKDDTTKNRRRTNGTRKKEPIMAATAQEAMEKVIHEKKLSSKINYNILKEIEDSDELPSRQEVTADSGKALPEKEEELTGSGNDNADSTERPVELSSVAEVADSKKSTYLLRRKISKPSSRKRAQPDPAALNMVKQALSDVHDTKTAKISLTQKEFTSISSKEEDKGARMDEEFENKRSRKLTSSSTASTSKDICSSTVLIESEEPQPSTSCTAADEADIASRSSSSITEMEKERKRPKRLHIAEETPAAPDATSSSALSLETSGASASAPRKLPAKTRYIRALPNLTCARTEKRDSAATVSEILPTTSGDSAAEQMNIKPEISRVTRSTKMQDNESAPGEESTIQKTDNAKS